MLLCWLLSNAHCVPAAAALLAVMMELSDDTESCVCECLMMTVSVTLHC